MPDTTLPRDASPWNLSKWATARRRRMRVPGVEALEDRTLLAVTMLGDLNQADVTPIDLTPSGAKLYFLVPDSAGQELWVSDGTPQNTTEVTHVNASSYGFSSDPLVPGTGGRVFFASTSAAGDTELWVSDGTLDGTVAITNLNAGHGGMQIGEIVQSTSTFFSSTPVYFTANDGTHGWQLWTTDGTTAGTKSLTTITAPQFNYSPTVLDLTPAADSSGTVYFVADDATTGEQIWDVSAAFGGPPTVVQLTSGAGITGSVSDLTYVNGTVFFLVTNYMYSATGPGTEQSVVERVDSTTPGGVTTLTPTLATGQNIEGGFTALGNKLVFVASITSATTGRKSYTFGTSDGTVAGTFTSSFQSFSNAPANLTALGNTLLFSVNDGTTGTELWATSESGFAQEVDDLWPGPGSSIQGPAPGTPYYPAPSAFVNVNGTVYFAAATSALGLELWKTDGTTVSLAADVNPGAGSSIPEDLVNFNGVVAFVAHDGTGGNQVWTTDGLPTGTAAIATFNPAQTQGSDPTPLGVVNGVLYFQADDGVHGPELWSTDGTAAHTALFKDLTPGVDGSNPNVVLPYGTGFLVLAGGRVWASDGTPAGTTPISPASVTANPSVLVKSGNLYYFTAPGYNSAGQYATVDLWSTNGTAASTHEVAVIDSGSANTDIGDPTDVNGTLYFTVNATVSTGTPPSFPGPTYELWKSDGTQAGTVLVQTGAVFDAVTGMTSFRNELFFLTQTALEASDPATGSTATVRPSLGLTAGFYGMVTLGGRLAFVAGNEVWVTDGSPAGTTMVTNTALVSSTSSPESLTSVNGQFEFAAVDATTGLMALFRSDGTTAGTAVVHDFTPAAGSTIQISQITPVGAGAYFLVDQSNTTTSQSSTALWWTDGTSALPVPGADFTGAPGVGLQGILAGGSYVALVGQTLVFTADDGVHGAELWALTNAPPVVGAITDRTTVTGQTVSFSVNATDPDPGQTVKYSLGPGAPAGASINATTGAFSWTPTAAQASATPYTITVDATDNGLPTPQSTAVPFHVTVNAPNTKPTLSPIANMTVIAGTALSFTASATDPDAGQTITYSLGAGAPAGASIDSSTGAFTWTPTAAQVAGSPYTVTVRATDDGTPPLSDQQSFTVVVFGPPGAPRLSAGSDTGTVGDGLTRDNGSAGAPLTFIVSGVSPANGFVRLYDADTLALLTPLPVQATGGSATITLAGGAALPFSDGAHHVEATDAATASGVETAPSATSAFIVQSSLLIVSTTPSDKSFQTALPGGQVVVVFNHTLAGLTDGQSPISSSAPFNPYDVFLLARGPDAVFSAPDPNVPNTGDLPLHADVVYHTLPGGESEFVITPTEPMSTDVYLISVGLNTFTDLAGNPLTDSAGGYRTFLLQPPPSSTAALQVTGVTAENGAVTVNGNTIVQPDALTIHFNRPLYPGAATGGNVELIAQLGPASYLQVAATAAYSPTADAIVLVPNAPLNPGTNYIVAVGSAVSADQNFGRPGQALGAPYYNSFHVSNAPLGPGSGPFEVATDGTGNPVLLPQANNDDIWTAPIAYAAATFTKQLDPTSLERYSFMFLPQRGGLIDTAFDPGDLPLNGVESYNPNTRQLIFVPSQPVGNDIYEYALGNLRSTAGDALLNNAGQPAAAGGNPPYYETFLEQKSLSATAASRSAALLTTGTVATPTPAPPTTAFATVPARPLRPQIAPTAGRAGLVRVAQRQDERHASHPR